MDDRRPHAARAAHRTALVAKLGSELGREIAARTVFFQQAVATRAGLSVTDLKCLDYVVRGLARTAGDLTSLSGLTGGAVTGVINRLEAAGYVRRTSEPGDRRKVLVVPVERRTAAEVESPYASLERGMKRLANRYSDAELELLCDFMARVGELLTVETRKALGGK